MSLHIKTLIFHTGIHVLSQKTYCKWCISQLSVSVDSLLVFPLWLSNLDQLYLISTFSSLPTTAKVSQHLWIYTLSSFLCPTYLFTLVYHVLLQDLVTGNLTATATSCLLIYKLAQLWYQGSTHYSTLHVCLNLEPAPTHFLFPCLTMMVET